MSNQKIMIWLLPEYSWGRYFCKYTKTTSNNGWGGFV